MKTTIKKFTTDGFEGMRITFEELLQMIETRGRLAPGFTQKEFDEWFDFKGEGELIIQFKTGDVIFHLQGTSSEINFSGLRITRDRVVILEEGFWSKQLEFHSEKK